MPNNTKLVYRVIRWHHLRETKAMWEKSGFSTEVTLDPQAIPEMVTATGAQVVILDLDLDDRGHFDCQPLLWLRKEMGDRVKIIVTTSFSPDPPEYTLNKKTADYFAGGFYDPQRFLNVIRNL